MSTLHFQFPVSFGDARVEELKLLSWTAQHGDLTFDAVPLGPWHDLLVYLILNELLTVFDFKWAKQAHASDADPNPDLGGSSGIAGESPIERARMSAKIRAVYDLHEMRPPAGLRLTHLGRVRLSELKQAIRTGREREPFGILWDVRHWEQDLQVEILDSRQDLPLSVAYLDMNGMREVNNQRGHDAGDIALRSYFQAITSVLPDHGQAYRLGGDEVLVLLPNHDAHAAARVVELACKKLMNERLELLGEGIHLSIAAGVITSGDSQATPMELRSAADKVQFRAKEQSRKATPRPSVIAVNGLHDMVVIEHHLQASGCSDRHEGA